MDIEQEYQQRSRLLSNRFFRFMLIGLVADFLLLLGPVDSYADQNLTLHMFQHIGLFVAAMAFGYGLDRYIASHLDVLREKFHFGWSFLIHMIKFNVKTRGLVLGAALPAIVISYWHYPTIFDLTTVNENLHILEHFSYIVVGGIVGMSIMAMPNKIRLGLLVFSFMQIGMMGQMMLVWPSFYPAYSASQNVDADLAMTLVGAIGIIGSSSTLLKYLDIL